MIKPINIPDVLHLRTQDGQPYGSRRLCCEYCGIMISALRPGDVWTSDREAFNSTRYPEYVRCGK